MAKAKWDETTIIKRILMLSELDEDLSCSHIKEIDSALVGAAISYFGNWSAALDAAGLDHEQIRIKSIMKRSEKVRKWSINKVLEEIREVVKTEDDLSYAYMKEKHSSLVAAASNYIGSWKKALEMCGYDYAEVLRTGREKKLEREKSWYKNLLLERLDKIGSLDEKMIAKTHPRFHKMLISQFSSWNKVVRAVKSRDKRKDSPSV